MRIAALLSYRPFTATSDWIIKNLSKLETRSYNKNLHIDKEINLKKNPTIIPQHHQQPGHPNYQKTCRKFQQNLKLRFSHGFMASNFFISPSKCDKPHLWIGWCRKFRGSRDGTLSILSCLTLPLPTFPRPKQTILHYQSTSIAPAEELGSQYKFSLEIGIFG